MARSSLEMCGLSPLARGTHCLTNKARKRWRFIPAGAGNTRQIKQTHDPRPVYPRWRGEHYPRYCSKQGVNGLSPLARGTHFVPVLINPVLRFIPSGAGNTIIERNYSREKPVYPRWRGEHAIDFRQRQVIAGLSPLARGTLGFLILSGCTVRFIPAGAGNTRLFNIYITIYSVYPRWRGEHFNSADPVVIRFIPAGAGNTYQKSGEMRARSVYPRWRGEHTARTLTGRKRRGLSPLARGTPNRPVTVRHIARFIPAGAGNTCPQFASFLTHPVYPRWRGEHTKTIYLF